MKAETIYRSDDGAQWPTPEQAIKRDALIARVDSVMKHMPETPSGSHRRIAVSPGLAASAKSRIVDICREEYPREQVFSHPADEIHPMSYAGRFLSDVGGPLGRAWQWFMCYRDGYLYEQPFFALNPDQFSEERP